MIGEGGGGEEHRGGGFLIFRSNNIRLQYGLPAARARL